MSIIICECLRNAFRLYEGRNNCKFTSYFVGRLRDALGLWKKRNKRQEAQEVVWSSALRRWDELEIDDVAGEDHFAAIRAESWLASLDEAARMVWDNSDRKASELTGISRPRVKKIHTRLVEEALAEEIFPPTARKWSRRPSGHPSTNGQVKAKPNGDALPEVHAYLRGFQKDLEVDPAVHAYIDEKDLSDDQRAAWTRSMMDIGKDTYSLTNGRAYTVLSNFPRKMRTFLRYKGQPLVEVDLSNSHGYFLGVLVKREYWDLPPDVQEYLDLVSEGRIYQYLFDHQSCPIFADVDKAKKSFLGSLNAELCKYRGVRILTEHLFPTVHRFIVDKIESGTPLWEPLQTEEARFMFDIVATEFMEHPGRPCKEPCVS